MKKILMLFSAVFMLTLTGCYSTPEYFDELSREELNVLRNAARALALQGNAVPEHMKAVFVEMQPSERVFYDGDKRGKASFRWEIYDVAENDQVLTQKDINPYWVMVYATGDLRDPQWKLTHAHETFNTPEATPAGRAKQETPATVRNNNRAPVNVVPATPPSGKRPIQRGRIRY